MTRSHLPTLLLVLGTFLNAQNATVRGVVNVLYHSKNKTGSADVVIWLTSTRTKESFSPGTALLQKDKQFAPHMLVVTAGTAIEFPNQVPFFHDVSSIDHGKPFNLGLYESGAIRKVPFSMHLESSSIPLHNTLKSHPRIPNETEFYFHNG